MFILNLSTKKLRLRGWVTCPINTELLNDWAKIQIQF